MSIPEFDPARRAAFERLLAERVTNTAHMKRKRPPRWSGVAAFALAGILTGGAVSAAATSFDAVGRAPASPRQNSSVGLSGVSAPAGTTPGSPIISLLGAAESFQLESGKISPTPLISTPPGAPTSAARIDLTPPAAATHVRVTVRCLTPGSITWGLNAAGNNPSSSCSASDVGTRAATTFFDFALPGTPSTLYLDSDPSTTTLVTIQYVIEVETAWGINADGDTYGTAAKEGAGEPDLVAVTGQNPQGEFVDGYVRARDLAGTQPTSPDQASQRQEVNRLIPVYESDGHTQIGTFNAH